VTPASIRLASAARRRRHTCCSTMKLIAALLLTAVHAKVKPLQLRKTSGIKAVQAIDIGGKKASGGYGQWAKDNAAANSSA
jgi:hypothetical protein